MTNPKVLYRQLYEQTLPTYDDVFRTKNAITHPDALQMDTMEGKNHLLENVSVDENGFTALVINSMDETIRNGNDLTSLIFSKCTRCNLQRISHSFVTSNSISLLCNGCRKEDMASFPAPFVSLKHDLFFNPHFEYTLTLLLETSFTAAQKLELGLKCCLKVFNVKEERALFENRILTILENKLNWKLVSNKRRDTSSYFVCSQRKKRALTDGNSSVPKRICTTKRLFDCKGCLSLSYERHHCVCIRVTHELFHEGEKTGYALTAEDKETVRQLATIGMAPFQILVALRKQKQTYIHYQSVYNAWIDTMAKVSKHDTDPKLSVQKYIKQAHHVRGIFTNESPFATGFVTDFAEKIVRERNIVEAYIDSTYKTNSQAMELFAVMVSVLGVGFPVAYLIIQSPPNQKKEAGYRRVLITNFLLALRNTLPSLQPNFFFSDKDSAQLGAIRHAFKLNPSLCLWHMKRAIKRKCKSLKFVSMDLESKLFGLIDKHFFNHPFITDTARSTEEYRKVCCWEIIVLCYAHHDRLLFYLLDNWYDNYTFYSWGRRNDSLLSFSRTTMHVEAHWSVLKSIYLANYNRPRIDFVVYILDAHFVPKFSFEYEALLNGTFRPSWYKTFVRTWKKRRSESSSNAKYRTDYSNWICTCPGYLHNCFLICKHLVGTADPPPFSSIVRSRKPPFWVFESKPGRKRAWFVEEERRQIVATNTSRSLPESQIFATILSGNGDIHIKDDEEEAQRCELFQNQTEHILEICNDIEAHVRYLRDHGADMRQVEIVLRHLKPIEKYLGNVKINLNSRKRPKTFSSRDTDTLP